MAKTWNWNKINGISAMGCFIFAALTFANQIWPMPQLKQSQVWLPIAGPKLVGTFIVLGFAFSSFAIYRSWKTSPVVAKSPQHEKSKLAILHASYGPVDGMGFEYDVSEFFRKIIAGDSLVFKIENGSFWVNGENFVKNDPRPGTKKRLRIGYSYNGVMGGTVERLEHDLLVLPEDSAIGRLSIELESTKKQLECLSASQEITEEERKSIEYQNRLVNLGHAIEGILNPLQIEAIQLSSKLLGFIKDLGDPPLPKYTREQIDNMGTKEMKRLIDSRDGDFLEACEYYSPDKLHFTREMLDAQLSSHFTRLLPWYEKVRARYAIEFAGNVETLRNKYAIEEISDGTLSINIAGVDAVLNIRAIASRLWEMAFTLKEKEVAK